jgi:hypothetical protein
VKYAVTKAIKEVGFGTCQTSQDNFSEFLAEQPVFTDISGIVHS